MEVYIYRLQKIEKMLIIIRTVIMGTEKIIILTFYL